MTRTFHRRCFRFVLGSASAIAVVIAASACSDGSLFGDRPPSAIGDGGNFGDSSTPSSDASFGVGAAFAANGIVIVHAASLPAFRLCFEANKELLPIPSAQLMPDSNVAGVEVGSAVRIDPLPQAIGRVWLFEEPAIRPFYPPGQVGPTCTDLLRDSPEKATELGAIKDDLATGVHLLIVSGCRSKGVDPTASKERCGSTWDSNAGNVALSVRPLAAYQRPLTATLPVQVVLLSNALASRAGGRPLSLGFGALDAASPPPFLSQDLPFGEVMPKSPTTLSYAPNDTAAYASSGFHLLLDDSLQPPIDAGNIDGGGGGKKGQILLRQSLADVGRLSSSRDVPPEWFSAASSYVLLVLGDPDSADGGTTQDAAAAGNELTRLHLLAVPVAAPEEDAGADSGPVR